jgi:hypothetical protein
MATNKKTPTESGRKYNFALPPSYQQESKWVKFKRKIRSVVVNKIDDTFLKFRLYKCYLHYKLNKAQQATPEIQKTHYLYLKPNYGAGIGHQLANWNAGLYFAGYFKVNFAHYPFSSAKWDSFLGFGEGEEKVADLAVQGFKTVNLPRFDSENQDEIDLIGKIINSYKQKNVLFSLETDQGYMRQFDTSSILANKFFSASSRSNDKLNFSADSFNIAIHIRRRMAIETDPVWKERGLDNSYYANILNKVLTTIKTDKPIVVYLFSQGTIDDFPEFKDYKNIIYCMDMGPIDSVLHMIFADLLISSKSSFSYKPALITRGINIYPKSFWHGYPEGSNYIYADDDGNFDVTKLSDTLVNYLKSNIKL